MNIKFYFRDGDVAVINGKKYACRCVENATQHQCHKCKFFTNKDKFNIQACRSLACFAQEREDNTYAYFEKL